MPDSVFDEVSIERIRRGDPVAFEALFQAHFSDLRRFAAGMLGDPSDADDVVQEVFFRLWRGRERLTVEGSIRAYLFTGVRNRALDVLRQRKVRHGRRWTAPESGIDGTAEPECLDRAGHGALDCVADVPDPASGHDPAALAELREAVHHSLESLPERCRTTFLLCRDREMSYAEVAQVMGVSVATVRIQMGRALKALREAAKPFLTLLAVLL